MLSNLDLRNQTQPTIPSPVSIANRFANRDPVKTTVYDGQSLSIFILNNGGNPIEVREFLRHNQIGNVFEELYIGMPVEVQIL